MTAAYILIAFAIGGYLGRWGMRHPACHECGGPLTWYERTIAGGVCDLHWND